MEARRLRIVHSFISKSQSRTLERVIDQLTRYRLQDIDEVLDEIVNLAKEGKLEITKTNDGFKYTAKNVNKKDTQAE